MAEVHVFGRVTNDLQLKMSHRQVPYVSFGLVEWIGRRDTGHRQYFEVWAWGTAALSLADAEITRIPASGFKAFWSWWTVPETVEAKRTSG